MTKVLLYSSGMDSVAMDFLWKPDVRLYVDMGTAYAEQEKALLPADAVVVPLPLKQFERPDGIIPLRNLMLVAVAAQFGTEVGMAATKGDRVLDKSFRFASLASDLMSFLWSEQHWTPGKKVKVALPLKLLSKREIVAAYLEAGGDGEVLASRTFSCYAPTASGAHCGACKPCYRKWVALTCNGISAGYSARAYIEQHILPAIKDGTFGRGDEGKDVLDALTHAQED